jgi:hypothetical protein
MKALKIILVLFVSCICSYGQEAIKTKLFFEKISSQRPFDSILKNKEIIIKDVNLENIITDKYNLMKVYENIDFNLDGRNDLLLYIDRYVEEDDKFKAKEASNYNYRILLVLISQPNEKYIFSNKLITLLNQNTEGLFNSSFKIFIISDTLYVREYGRQIDTDWCTEMAFTFDKSIKNWVLKKAVIYSAEISSDEEKIIKPVKTYNINDVITIDSVSYYKYFPFGFSDEVY